MSAFTIATESYAEEPHAAAYDRRLASFSRLIRFDPRGIGLSDPMDLRVGVSVDDMARDALAVLDAVGSVRATLIADDGAVSVAIALATMAPERVDRLVLVNGYARITTADGYPHGHPPDLVASFVEGNVDPGAVWSLDGADDRALIAPSLADDPAFADWWTRSSRRGASPTQALSMLRTTTRADVRDLLDRVSVPTLVIHRRDNIFTPVGCGRYLSESIPGATYVELPGSDQPPWAGDADMLLDEIQDFLTGRRGGSSERVLTTVLFTDIVDSTAAPRCWAIGPGGPGSRITTRSSAASCGGTAGTR